MAERDNAAFALDPLHHDARGTFADGLLERRHVVDGDEADAGQQRLEIGAVFRLSGYRQRAQGAAVKGIVQRDDLVFFAIDFVAVGAQPF